MSQASEHRHTLGFVQVDNDQRTRNSKLEPKNHFLVFSGDATTFQAARQGLTSFVVVLVVVVSDAAA